MESDIYDGHTTSIANGRIRIVNIRILIRAIWLFSLAFTLTACQGITTLPDGQISIMHGVSNRLRGQLAITSVDPQIAVSYIPVKDCSYREMREALNEPQMERRLDLSIKAIENRLLVVIRGDYHNVSTYLISKSGKLYDFNAIDPSRSERVTPQNYEEVTNRKLRQMNATRDPRYQALHLINEFSLAIPEYTTTFMRVGKTVAVVLSEDGNLWGEYKFRGTTLFGGIRAGVLDLVRTQVTLPQYGPTVVGFSVVDLTTMLPLIVVIDSGSTYQLERISCSQ